MSVPQFISVPGFENDVDQRKKYCGRIGEKNSKKTFLFTGKVFSTFCPSVIHKLSTILSLLCRINFFLYDIDGII